MTRSRSDVVFAHDLSVALATLARTTEARGGWVDTGAIADALGLEVGETAARLRGASRRGLCVSRRSLLFGTTWRLTDRGAAQAARLAAIE